MPGLIHNLVLSAVRVGLVPSPLKKALRDRIVFRTRPTNGMVKKYSIQSAEFDNETVYTFGEPQNGAPILYYGHGGGYLTGMFANYFHAIGRLYKALGAMVIVPDYPMPIETDAQNTRDWTLAHFRHVLSQYPESPIIIAGDSAGANLTLALAQGQSKAERSRVSALFMLYGWFNLDRVEADFPVHREEVLLKAELLPKAAQRFAGKRPLNDPMISPIFANLKGLPNMHIISGDKDMVFPDSVDLQAKAKSAGVKVSQRTHTGYGHCFWLFPTPDGQRALVEMAEAMAGAL